MISTRFTLNDLQDYQRDINAKIDALTTRNINMEQRRVINAGRSVSEFDYVVRAELREAIQKVTPTDQSVVQTGLLNTATTVRYGAFATRGAPTAHANSIFVATDHSYVSWVSTGAGWIYLAGENNATQAGLAAIALLLGANDANYIVNCTDFTHRLRWTGSAYTFAHGDPGSAWMGLFPVAPTGGTWGICDGSAYTYLKADGTTASFTTPNLGTAAYIKAGTSASVGPNAASGATAAPSATATVDNNLDGTTVAVGSGTHTHGPGTIELLNTQWIGYFRR